jgi:hypothetical protein
LTAESILRSNHFLSLSLLGLINFDQVRKKNIHRGGVLLYRIDFNRNSHDFPFEQKRKTFGVISLTVDNTGYINGRIDDTRLLSMLRKFLAEQER